MDLIQKIESELNTVSNECTCKDVFELLSKLCVQYNEIKCLALKCGYKAANEHYTGCFWAHTEDQVDGPTNCICWCVRRKYIGIRLTLDRIQCQIKHLQSI